MLQAEDLLDHASSLLAAQARDEVNYRRTVSACYYAVFHLISAAAAAQASPPIPNELRARCRRTLEHRAMKNAMASFLTPASLNRLCTETGIPCVFSLDLAEIARSFGELQDARHLADYDVVDLREKSGFRGHPSASTRLSVSLKLGSAPNRLKRQRCFSHP